MKTTLPMVLLLVATSAWADQSRDYSCGFTMNNGQKLAAKLKVDGLGERVQVAATLWDGVTKADFTYGEDGTKLPANVLPAPANPADYDVVIGQAVLPDGQKTNAALIVSKGITQSGGTWTATDFWATLGEDGKFSQFTCVTAP